jgi:hypothetical protein
VAESGNRRRRGRSRKRRPVGASAASRTAAQQAAPAPVEDESAPAPVERGQTPGRRGKGGRERPRGAAERERAARGSRGAGAAGERPRPPWYPLPLSELLILVGAIGTFVGLSRGVSHGGPALFAGLAAVMIGTIEVTLREHLGGYRSHTLILALLPTILFHSAVALGVAAFTRVPSWLNVVLLLLDVALFAFLFKLLRARFIDARRERTFSGRR